MEREGKSCESEKKKTRKEILEKKKAIENKIKAASLVKDNLSNFPQFRHYRRNGLYTHLESGCGNKLSVLTKQYIQNLLKLNMEAPYGPEWPDEEKIKRREMVSPEARYIFVHEISQEDAYKVLEFNDKERTCGCNGPIVGFVHYRFILEEEVPVVYVYELQLEPRVQGKGLGKFLMQLIELIACENRMGAVVLTVQKANLVAMDFYINKLSLYLQCYSCLNKLIFRNQHFGTQFLQFHLRELIHCWDQRKAMKFCVNHLTMKLKQSWSRLNIPQPTHEMLG